MIIFASLGIIIAVMLVSGLLGGFMCITTDTDTDFFPYAWLIWITIIFFVYLIHTGVKFGAFLVKAESVEE